jgi:hypothetical protein
MSEHGPVAGETKSLLNKAVLSLAENLGSVIRFSRLDVKPIRFGADLIFADDLDRSFALLR